MEGTNLLSCGHILQKTNEWSAGYGLDDRGKKICYNCCAQRDREEMMRSGRILLYLSRMPNDEWKVAQSLAGGNLSEIRHKLKVSNWPGSLVFHPYGHTKSQGWGFGGHYDIEYVWFVGPDGYRWIGRCAGRSEILRCHRLKVQSLSWQVLVWTCKDGGDYMHCWIRFRNEDGPFNEEEVRRVVEKFETLDQACEIMVKEA